MNTLNSHIGFPRVTERPVGIAGRVYAEADSAIRWLRRGQEEFYQIGIYRPCESPESNVFDDAIESLSPVWFTLRHWNQSIIRREKQRKFFQNGNDARNHFQETLNHYIHGINLIRHPIGAKITQWGGGVNRVDFYFELTPLKAEEARRDWTGFSLSNTRGFKIRFPLEELQKEIRNNLITSSPQGTYPQPKSPQLSS